MIIAVWEEGAHLKVHTPGQISIKSRIVHDTKHTNESVKQKPFMFAPFSSFKGKKINNLRSQFTYRHILPLCFLSIIISQYHSHIQFFSFYKIHEFLHT